MGALSRKWVLVVDDDAGVRDFVADALKLHGFAVLACSNGMDALDLVRTVVPHLIILDLRMPRASGAVFLDYLRGESVTLRQVPVLVVSGHLDEVPADGTGLNVVGWIEKPVRLDTLVTRVRNVIGTER